MSIVLEAALSAFFDGLLDNLRSSDLLNIFRQGNVDADLKKWAITLRNISAVLTDAEEKQMTDNLVKSWLAYLEDLTYDADDILDELATEALRRKLNAEEPSTSKIRKFIPACVVGFNPSSIKFNVCMRSKIEGITERLEEILTLKESLKLQDSAGGRTITTISRPATTSLAGSFIYGREVDKKAIIQLLLLSSDAQLSVIPIVGMGGLGKTTLAQLVYNDDEVSRYFDLKAWVCVSEEFDIPRLTKEILHSFTSESCHNNNNLDSLQGKLKNTLSGKKFLLILDDVWNENYELWTELRKPFEFGALGSTIIVTTRNYGVTCIMGTTLPYMLKELSNETCLRVFMNHALDATDWSEFPELEELGGKILDRCRGAPFAAKVLGGLLRKHDPFEWERVLNSKIWEFLLPQIWDIPEDKSNYFSILKLNYNYLPSHLKRCFAYCSLFPIDYKFKENEIVLLWMAEGLVPQQEENKPMEAVGAEYFHELVRRSFFQESSSDESVFVMNHLINDLAQWAARGICYGLQNKLRSNEKSMISLKVRHFSYIGYGCESITTFEDFNLGIALRTFLLISINNKGYITNYIPNCLLPRLRCLRVLSLSGFKLIELPSSICNLKHLRYLNLSHTKIRRLPESISLLYNLQTVILKGCSRLTMLIEKIGNLVNLRHLDITGANRIKGMPGGIKELKNLQTLSNFVVGKDIGSKIGDLMTLKFLRGKLCISSLENVLDAKDARKSNLNDKKNLDSLVMKWGPMHEELDDSRVSIDVLDMLLPCRGLKELVIEGYGGAKFPSWLGDTSFSNMVILRIQNCGKCTSLPAIGQLPHLKDLYIIGMARVKIIGHEFYGVGILTPFRSLEGLHFKNMQEWQEWIPLGIEYKAFPSLRELSIFQCPKLRKNFPNHLPLLKKLIVDGCEQLIESFPSLPMLHELKIVGCKIGVTESIVKLNPVKSMVLCIPRMKSLTEGFVQGLAKVECLTIKDCKLLVSLCQDKLKSLVMLDIVSCPRLVNISLPSTLRTMNIESCCALNSLHKEMMWSKCTCLEYVSVVRCNSLTSISSGHLPPTLKRIKIYGCENLKFVVEEEEASSSFWMNEENLNNNNNSGASLLEHLEIRDCPSLKSFSSRGDLPATLKHLIIDRCLELTSISTDRLPVALKHLSIKACQKLESVADNLHDNMSLDHLQIWQCEKLKSLPEGLHKLYQLKVFSIRKCSCLVSFPNEGFLSTSLSRILIEDCEKLKSFPNGMDSLTSLLELSIHACPNIVFFPKEGFPTNLRSLKLSEVHICKQLFEWGLHRFTSLENLSLSGGCPDWQSFPKEEDGKMMVILPTSLTRLEINNFPNIVVLYSKGFQNLFALKFLSLKNCPKLAFLPENGLPPSLLELRINECPVLKQHFEKGKGREWFKIANIPCVLIDDRSVYELEEKY